MNYKYQKLKQHLVRQIQDGTLGNGEKLATEPELMERYQVSRNTLRQAMQELEKEGYIRKIQGNGTFIQSQTPGSIRKIALIVSDLANLVHPVTIELLKGLEEVLKEQNYKLDIFASERNYDEENLKQLAETYSGFILTAANIGPLTLKAFDARRIPWVFLKNYVRGYEERAVRVDYRAAGFLAAEHVVRDCGRHRLAIVYMGGKFPASEDFRDGVREACLEYGAELKRNHIFEAIPESFDGIDGIVTYDEAALELLVKFRRTGIEIPKDISIIGINNLPLCSYVFPEITSVELHFAEAGRQAANYLLETINGNQPVLAPPIPPELVIRNSSCSTRK